MQHTGKKEILKRERERKRLRKILFQGDSNPDP